MTSLVTVKRQVEMLKQKVKPKPDEVITVVMWRPDGKDVPYDGGPIRIKALKETEPK